jgi:GGDEF domain-containing protein
MTTLLSLPEASQTLPQILHLADLVAEFLIQERPRLLNEIFAVGDAYCGIAIEQIEQIIAELETKVPQLADILSLKLPEDTPYSAILLQAYAQINDVAEAGTPEFQNPSSDSYATESEALRGVLRQLAGRPDATASFAEAAPAEVMNTRLEQVTMAVSALDPVRWPDLLQLVEAAVFSCRQARCALSLTLLEVDDADSFMLRQGPELAAQALRRLHVAMESIVDRDGRIVQCDDYRFAVLLENCERQYGVELARQLVAAARRRGSTAAGSIAFSLSAGLATLSVPSKNFQCEELIEAAERCLNGVRLSGGDSVKSIDIF